MKETYIFQIQKTLKFMGLIGLKILQVISKQDRLVVAKINQDKSYAFRLSENNKFIYLMGLKLLPKRFLDSLTKLWQRFLTEAPKATDETEPTYNNANISNGNVFLADTAKLNIPVAERFRLMSERIERLNMGKRQNKLISVTSAIPGEGKSMVAVNSARAFAAKPNCKTLIIDCDLRRPSIHNYFNVQQNPGLSDAALSRASIFQFIMPITNNLDVITAGSTVKDPMAIIDSNWFMNTLASLMPLYDYIILDCPPVLLCPETTKIVMLTDKTLMVVKGWETTRRLVKDALQIISKDKLLGIILNNTSEESRQYKYNHYYATPAQTNFAHLKHSRMVSSNPSLLAA